MKELLQHIDKQNKNDERKYFTEPQIPNVYFDLYTAWTIVLCLETDGQKNYIISQVAGGKMCLTHQSVLFFHQQNSS